MAPALAASTAAYSRRYDFSIDSVEIDTSLRIPAGRHTYSPEKVAELQRERLVRAIIACSAKRGYQSTTIADIVGLAGTSRSAFYEHFESKEACFLAAYAQMSATMQDVVVSSGLDAPTWREALDVGLATYFEWFRERPDQAAAFLVEIRTVGPEALKARARVLERMSGRLKLLGLRARHEDPSLPELDDVAYASIIITADELAHEHVRRGRAARLGELVAPVQYLARLVFAGADASRLTPPARAAS